MISRNHILICLLLVGLLFICSSAVYGADNSTSQSSSPAASTQAVNNSSLNNTTVVHGGIWLREYDMKKVNLNQLKSAGITDIFLHENALKYSTYKTQVTSFLSKAKSAGIRVNIWLCTFHSNGKWVDPTGRYSYTVSIPYKATVNESYKVRYQTKVKVAHSRYVKSYYKSYYYNSYGKLKYKWKYKWVKKTYYTYKYRWVTVTKYSMVTKTLYKKETRYAYNMDYINQYKASLISKITKYAKISGVEGIHLDYLRYPGTAYKSPNGTASITSFVAKVDAALNKINPKIMLSAALMPETNYTDYYYGQNYTQLAQYLDVLIPMVYEGNYKADNAWITATTSYIVNQSAGKPVWSGLQSYYSDGNTKALPASQLVADVQSAVNGGASGYVLFRYGLIDGNFYTLIKNVKVAA